MGDKQDFGKSKSYEITPARAGSRPRGYSWRYNEVGIPVLLIRNAGFHFSRTGEERVVSNPADLLVKAKEVLDIEDLMRVREFPKRPKTLCSVVIEKADGTKGSLEVVLTTVLPQQIKGDWVEIQEAKRKEREQERKWAQEKAEKEAAEVERSADITRRLDALLGEEKGPYKHSGERYDCYRDGYRFAVSEETLLKLLELAEKGAEK